MSRIAHSCHFDVPDCFSCPYPECYATLQDINRQEVIRNKEMDKKRIEERNKKIIELHNQGIRNKDIAIQLNVTKAVVQKVLGIYKRSLQ